MGKHRFLISRKAVLVAMLVLLVCTIAELAMRSGWLRQMDYLYYDLWHILAGVQVEPKHVAIISIDNETQLNYQDEPLVFWGPHFAKGIEVLRRLEVRVIGLDYLFTVSAESWVKRFEVPGSEKSRTFDGSIRAQLSTGKVVLIGWLASNEKGEGELILPIKDYLFVLPGGVSDVGFANFYSDEDGVIRRFAPALFDGDTLPNLTFATLLAVKGSGLEPSSKRWSLGGRGIHHDTTTYPIGFVGPPGTIPRLSFAKLLEPMAEKNPELQWLKGKVVIIAPEHVGIQDFHLAPYAREFWKTEGRLMSGGELHANIVETLLSGRFSKSVPSWVRVFGMVIFLLIATLLFFRLHPLRGLIVGLLLGLFCSAIAYFLFRLHWIQPISGVQLGLVLTYLGTLGFRLTGEEKERALLRQMFGQYVSDEVVEKLLATGHRPDLGGEAIRVTILFSDIRNFTTISERLSPRQVVDMLNAYLGRACEAILEQGGTVDKYIGDAVMAVFGSPVPYPDHPQRALSAALAIKEMTSEFRIWMHEHFAGVTLPEFDIGIGIHTGEAVIGNIGSPKRMEFTAIGDVVNTASRLEGLTKELGWKIAASSATVHAAGSNVLTGKREKVFLKGREGETEVFEVIGLKLEKGGES
jgi:class 3 adenylate cyclase/CHASE2 domain-containing sensor protein